MDIRVVIPARYASTRLPGKPLIPIAGMPMIERTWRQCAKVFAPDHVTVATDDERIANHCRHAGIPVVMTSSDCLTGSDRVAEAATQLAADYYINVQGDEPLLDPDDVRTLAAEARRTPQDALIGICPITDEAMFRDPSVPKAVFRNDGRLLYASRAAIPATMKGSFERAWRTLGIYGYPPRALESLARRTEKSTLEAIEDHEALRLLEFGMEFRVVELSGQSLPVDTPEDVARVEAILKQREMRTPV